MLEYGQCRVSWDALKMNSLWLKKSRCSLGRHWLPKLPLNSFNSQKASWPCGSMQGGTRCLKIQTQTCSNILPADYGRTDPPGKQQRQLLARRRIPRGLSYKHPFSWILTDYNSFCLSGRRKEPRLYRQVWVSLFLPFQSPGNSCIALEKVFNTFGSLKGAGCKSNQQYFPQGASVKLSF